MGRRRARMPVFTIGDFVFAKVRGYRAWPARILNRVGATAYNVYFYGTCNYAKVPRNQVVDFEKNQRRLGVVRPKGYVCNPTFRGAMMHARQAFANPDKDFGYYQQLAVDNGDCVDAEDLELEYMVTEHGGHLQEEQGAKEQVAAEQDKEVNSVGQVFSNQENEPDSKKPALDCQMEKQEESNSVVLKEQVSERYYSMAQLVSLKSKKLDTVEKLANRKSKISVSKDQLKRARPQLVEQVPEQQDSTELVEHSKPQLPSVNSKTGVYKLQEKISKDLLDKQVDDLMKMLEDIEEYTRKEEAQELEELKVEEIYYRDTPIDMSCQRHR
ncbi:uncharacterized protein LOC122620858 [Drosophila teissieri]|uniref:uncharacterized protein LOC122620858 n=1 Tax=Drosophila teissieri TaxID=7243 RepID=UPI001CB9DE9D|nr:uncharacterized protein LOC122620858 [Drosophila teissieri]